MSFLLFHKINILTRFLNSSYGNKHHSILTIVIISYVLGFAAKNKHDVLMGIFLSFGITSNTTKTMLAIYD